MKKKENKDVSKSVRMTKTVYDYVNSIEGEGFNQKFENMVNLCFEEVPKRINEIKNLDEMIKSEKKRLEKLKNEIYDRQSKSLNLVNNLEYHLKSAIENVKKMEKDS